MMCERCQGKGSWRCETCRGQGQSHCLSCSGSGKKICGTCGGMRNTQRTQFINGQYVTDYQMCTGCLASGQVNCFTCSGTGTETCTICGGQGTQRCNACGGQGEVADGVIARVDLSVQSSVLAPTDLPAAAKQIEASRTTLVDNAVAIREREAATDGLQRVFFWALDVPCAKVAYDIGGKRYESVALGAKLGSIEHAPFLDELYKTQATETSNVAHAKESNAAALEDAVRRLMTFGLGAKAIERVARGSVKGEIADLSGAASAAFADNVNNAARQLLLRIGENEVGGFVIRAAAIAIPALAVLSLVGLWSGLGDLLGASPLLIATLLSFTAACVLAASSYMKVSKRIAALCGMTPTRLTVGWPTWVLLAGVFLAAPLAQTLRSFL